MDVRLGCCGFFVLFSGDFVLSGEAVLGLYWEWVVVEKGFCGFNNGLVFRCVCTYSEILKCGYRYPLTEHQYPKHHTNHDSA